MWKPARGVRKRAALRLPHCAPRRRAPAHRRLHSNSLVRNMVDQRRNEKSEAVMARACTATPFRMFSSHRTYNTDVVISSTGAIAASCLCSYAMKKDRRYIWTKCDPHPPEFLGGHVHFKSPAVCTYPMIVDFASMYPSIMRFLFGISRMCRLCR